MPVYETVKDHYLEHEIIFNLYRNKITESTQIKTLIFESTMAKMRILPNTSPESYLLKNYFFITKMPYFQLKSIIFFRNQHFGSKITRKMISLNTYQQFFFATAYFFVKKNDWKMSPKLSKNGNFTFFLKMYWLITKMFCSYFLWCVI